MSRSAKAVIFCILSAILLLWIFGDHLWSACIVVSAAWLYIANWLSGRKLVTKPIRQLYDESKRGTLTLTGLALGIERMSIAWGVAAVVMFFR
jgi:hypothetical protein